MRHMNKYLLILPLALSVMAFASPASAQGSGTPQSGSVSARRICNIPMNKTK